MEADGRPASGANVLIHGALVNGRQATIIAGLNTTGSNGRFDLVVGRSNVISPSDGTYTTQVFVIGTRGGTTADSVLATLVFVPIGSAMPSSPDVVVRLRQ